jgi:hypothetical protein
MKPVKLFEQFIAESKKLDILIDVLANLEDAFTEEEFVEFGQDVNVDPATMSKIFNDYWDIDPRERLHSTTQDWKNWLNKNYNVR